MSDQVNDQAYPPMADGAPQTVAELLFGRPPMVRELPSFDPDGTPSTPGPLFAEWLALALRDGVLDPQVVTLSTVGTDGVPDARMLVLRDVDAAGADWVFAIDADSPKGRQLAAHPVAAMTAYWPLQGRQVRVRGTVRPAAPEVSAAEFATRSPGARVAALVGHQSEPLSSLGEYEDAAVSARRLLGDASASLVPTHTVYTLRACEVEFWQGDASRRHVRLCYTRTGPGEWARTLLWP
ncbi:pyridoxal 5'-phosphate synthase [Kitasatospora sp. NBC_00315]|uniref:pyridoxine/pyridoxamine 5'-phosphate oxidase n=1 Tax=Kitasatospora sp. NBC_00315 TaxID=2975963 RepID=UPI003250C9AE